jgi:hypothetical protein
MLLAKLRPRPQELLGARRPPARCPQWSGPRGLQLQAAPLCQPNIPTKVFGNLDLSSFLSFFQLGFILLLHFLPRSSPSSAATATGMVASVVGTAVADAAIKATPGPAPDGQPQTPEGVPEDMVEDSEGELEVVPELVPEVVREEALVKGVMITVARRWLLRHPVVHKHHFRWCPCKVAATGEGMEVVQGHPTPYAPGDISVGEAVNAAHQALSQAQRVLYREGEDHADEHRRLQLWASLLKRTMVSERAAAWAR